MSLRSIRPLLAAAGLAAVCSVFAAASAQETPLAGKAIVTDHAGTFNGTQVAYEARVSEITLANDDGEATATISATAYTRKDAAGDRPVIFIWNGGPSAASITLHMAGFGPKRLVIPADVEAAIEPPYETVDNDRTLLDVADLVFVDPVETGFSRILPAGERAYFYSAQGDAESVAQFIGEWLAANDRLDSPRFIMGTSYGSVRAPIVAGVMAETDTPLDGVILFSQAVNLVESTQRRHSLVGYAVNMPQLAAIAHFHGRTAYQNKSVYDLIEDAYDYFMSDYLTAIAKGSRLSESEKRKVARRMEAFTGVSAETYLEKDLLLNKGEFRQALLKEEGLVLASNDARYAAAPDSGASGNPPVQGAEAAHEAHMADFLGVGALADDYVPFAPETGSWDYMGSTTLGYRKVALGAPRSVFADYDWIGELEKAFGADDGFRLFIATGIYDTLTTAGPARLLASDPHLPGERLELHEYEGGHSFYSNDAEFGRLADDIRAFLDKSID